MNITALIELLKMFPKSTQVLVQTCEGDLLSPLEKKHIWATEAFIDERYKNLEPSKLVITSFIKGQKTVDYNNNQRGLIVKYEPVEEQQS